MKKIITLIFLLSSVFCYSQSRFSFGLRTGYIVPKHGFINVSSRGGFQAGAFTEIRTTKWFYIQAEILYSISGSTQTIHNSGGGPIVPVYTDVKLYSHARYLDIPVQAKVKIGKVVKPYYMLGLAPSVLLSSYITNDKTKDKWYLENEYHTVSLNLYNTAGVEFSLGKISPFIDVRYVNGITSLSKNMDTTFKGWTISGGVNCKF
jgi:hypothetical protein